MTQDEIRKLLGGYATNALSADERRILFEAALEDQDLFNALQNEDALRELLSDPMLRDQVRRALATPAAHGRRAAFSWRRWVLGVAMPATVAVILIVVMNRANAPKLISMRQQPAVSPADSPAAPPQAAPPPAAPHEEAAKLKAAPQVAKKQSASIRVPQPQAAAARLESAQRDNGPVAARFRAAGAPSVIPEAVRQQFAAGFAANASLYQGPLVRFSVARGAQDGNAVRVDVSTAIAGYLALYHVDAAGNSKRVYPANEVATQVLPNIAMQILINPVKVDAGEKLRLVLVPAVAPGVAGALGGVADNAAQPAIAKPLPPPNPLVVDIPIGPN